MIVFPNYLADIRRDVYATLSSFKEASKNDNFLGAPKMKTFRRHVKSFNQIKSTHVFCCKFALQSPNLVIKPHLWLLITGNERKTASGHALCHVIITSRRKRK